MSFGARQLFGCDQSPSKEGVSGVSLTDGASGPKKDADRRTVSRGALRGRLQGSQLFLQVFDAGFPRISAQRQVTVRDPHLSNLLLFLSRSLFPPITTGSEFPRLSGSIPFVTHHCIPT